MTRLVNQGDPALVMTREGLDLEAVGGLVSMGEGLENAVNLSLLGGNYLDSGREGDRANWWGNCALPAQRRLRSEFQHALLAHPLTSGYRNVLIEAARRDLAWLRSGGYVDAINIDVAIESRDAVRVRVELTIGATRRTFDVWSGAISRLLSSSSVPSEPILQSPLDPSTLAPPDLSRWGALVLAYGPEYVALSGANVSSYEPWPGASLQAALAAPAGASQPTIAEWGVGLQKAVTHSPGQYRSPTPGYASPVLGTDYCQSVTWRHDSLGTTRRLFSMYHGTDTSVRIGDVWVYEGGELCWYAKPCGGSYPLYNVLSRSGLIRAGGRYTLLVRRSGAMVSIWLNGEQLGEGFVGGAPVLSGAYYGPTVGAYPGGSTTDGQITVRNVALWNSAPDPIALSKWAAATFGTPDLIAQGQSLLATSLSTYYGEDAVGTAWPAASGTAKQTLLPVGLAPAKVAWGTHQVPRFTGTESYGLDGTAVWERLSGARPYSIVTLAFGEPNGGAEQGLVSLGCGGLAAAYTYLYRTTNGLHSRSSSSGAVLPAYAGSTWNYGMLHDEAGGVGFRRVDGEGAAGGGETAYAYNRFTIGSLRRTGGVEQGFVGRIAAVAVFDRVLSNMEFAAVRAALAAKYGNPLREASSFGDLLYSYGPESAQLNGTEVTAIFPNDGTPGPILNGGGGSPDISTSWGYGQQSDIRATTARDGRAGSWTRPGTIGNYTIACVFTKLDTVNGRLFIIRDGAVGFGSLNHIGSASVYGDGRIYWYISPVGTTLTGTSTVTVATGSRNTVIIQRVGSTASVYLNGVLLASGDVGAAAIPSQTESVHYLEDTAFSQDGKHGVRSLLMWKYAPNVAELHAWLKAKYGTA